MPPLGGLRMRVVNVGWARRRSSVPQSLPSCIAEYSLCSKTRAILVRLLLFRCKKTLSIMFSGGSGFGGALKNLGSKAEQLLEKKKQDVEKLGEEKKKLASDMLEDQVKKTGEALVQTKKDAETLAADSAKEAKHSAIDAFDDEFGKAEKAVDSTLQAASTAVDSKMKEADKFIDDKRDQAIKGVTAASNKAHETKEDVNSSLLGKAKGVLNF